MRHRSDEDERENDEYSNLQDRELPRQTPSITKLWIDTYFGRGKNDPPFTLRLSRVEDDMEDVKSRTVRMERLAWSILVGLIMVFAAIVFKK